MGVLKKVANDPLGIATDAVGRGMTRIGDQFGSGLMQDAGANLTGAYESEEEKRKREQKERGFRTGAYESEEEKRKREQKERGFRAGGRVGGFGKRKRG